MTIENLYNIIKQEITNLKHPLFKLYISVYETFLSEGFNVVELETLFKLLLDIFEYAPDELKKITYPEIVFEDISTDNNFSSTLPDWIKEKQAIFEEREKLSNFYANKYNIEINSPSLATQAVNFVSAAKDFVGSGFKLVTNEQYEERKKICSTCIFFDPEGFGGLGKCKKCGCSGYKLNVAVSVCPVGLWGSIE